MTSRSIPLFLLGAALLGGCGGPETPSSIAEEEGALVPAVRTETGGTAAGDVTASAVCDDVATWDPAWAGFEDQVLALVNQRRAAGAVCGGVTQAPAPALTHHASLRCAARRHSKDMGTNNFMSHTGSNGSTPWQRITATGYTYRRAAENVAAGYSTPAAVVNGWMASSGHCTNIMNPLLVHIGIGYFNAPSSTYRHYWTQDFGTP
ncbi:MULTISPECIES: CAP domain-containing protein [Myxococcus]|uniref:CAP domain-containing protein n=1 Tax=Myxococcus llanfairpwllgwyngyllgogerychwyrndrobwllllantysiliogogogochensis TaxID=2590453 RepID=A0A540XA52_9BACT|nr:MULTISPECIES: CAP domain-containing protein [Myxococcus]NTX08732.1 CAP domain-containing protein [Myxococcus sp. CA040A]NTX11958.1 CAP domain-containing protein [Myxococcus sp. CA056]NTX50717.1 CAP domain-containing protein [Myxococcus sp. CA039A]TQF17554.1 CAP domain-containing protein [Myxococcus llanfairpwllgwyngyllgogerychwyrndrobwllllantysiliogogogochensis]